MRDAPKGSFRKRGTVIGHARANAFRRRYSVAILLFAKRTPGGLLIDAPAVSKYRQLLVESGAASRPSMILASVSFGSTRGIPLAISAGTPPRFALRR